MTDTVLMAGCPRCDWSGELVDAIQRGWWLPRWLKRSLTIRCPQCKAVIANKKTYWNGWSTGVTMGSIWEDGNA